MAVPSGNIGKTTLLPTDVTNILQKRAIEALGLCIAMAGASLILVLISYHPDDPSFNSATEQLSRNWLGRPGASIADVLMQTIGMASWVLPLTLMGWGWQIGTQKSMGRLWIRVTLLPISLLLAALALAGPKTGTGWILNAGYGGITGDILLIQAVSLITQQYFVQETPIALTAGVLGMFAWIGTLGISKGQWRRFGKFFIWLCRYTLRISVIAGRDGLRAGRWSASLIGGDRSGLSRREPFLVAGAVNSNEQEDEWEDHDRPTRQEPLLTRPSKRNIVAPRKESAPPGKRAEADRQAALDLGPSHEFILPSLDILQIMETRAGKNTDADSLAENARLLESVLEDFGVQGEVVKVRPGPVVTLYEFEPAPGIKSSRVIGLADDIARSMSAISVRVSVIPGRSVMGIELPNSDREFVSLRELLSSKDYERTTSKLSLVLGKDIGGSPIIADLARMPHLLIAGTTGSGKSVAINTMIASLLYHLPPEQCRLVMIDPKMLELSVYDGIPHLLCPVVTDPRKAVVALRWTVREMEQRYRSMSTLGVRNIASYNARLEEATKTGELLTRTVQTGFDSETGEPVYEEQPLDMTLLPYVVVIVDEMADLMLVAGKEVEASVQRIAQMARAAGIHLIMATQRPSVDVITGTIKANFPTRVSFQVTSKIDSRTILGESGAEQLLGQGDMLYMAGGGRITRVHGPLVTDEEVERLVTFLKGQGPPKYIEEVTKEELETLAGPVTTSSNGEDALYDQAVALVCRERKASTSFVQRHLQIGYNRAARIIDRMEAESVISSANHVGKRDVLARDIGNLDT